MEKPQYNKDFLIDKQTYTYTHVSLSIFSLMFLLLSPPLPCRRGVEYTDIIPCSGVLLHRKKIRGHLPGGILTDSSMEDLNVYL